MGFGDAGAVVLDAEDGVGALGVAVGGRGVDGCLRLLPVVYGCWPEGGWAERGTARLGERRERHFESASKREWKTAWRTRAACAKDEKDLKDGAEGGKAAPSRGQGGVKCRACLTGMSVGHARQDVTERRRDAAGERGVWRRAGFAPRVVAWEVPRVASLRLG